jgi:phosphopantothenoylcysteine decarboxylase / phosphopantothenate---cysteine ligase
MARLLLIIGGGIAAYKGLELIRRAREREHRVRVVMTAGAQQFVTPLSVGAISGGQVFTDLWALDGEHEIGHIRLSREADLIVVAPATADLMAKMVGGHADDLATAVLLATDKPVLVAPAMNPLMWAHPATQRNVKQLAADGVAIVGPELGEMAESGEAGLGRMAEPMQILAAIEAALSTEKPLAGRHILVTSGPTLEPIDPVRFMSNRSSGKQGHAIAAAAARLGARVTLISGPVALPDPLGVTTKHIETAREMLAATEAALPADVAIFAAAVADWRTDGIAGEKIKKTKDGAPKLDLVENPDILRTLSAPGPRRPKLVVGFAAETQAVVENAKKKLANKGCDWIVANDVSPKTGTFGGDRNTVHLVSAAGVERWPELSKQDVAIRLVQMIAKSL